MVKAGVQFGLFAGAIQHLGTERHHERYLADAISGRLLGCFAMTETGHGSNVQALGTTATYDEATGEFVVHTPPAAARKDYIGNAARHGRMAAVFAQLVVGGETSWRALPAGADPGCGRCRAAGRDVVGLRAEARAERRRQRADRLRPGPGAAGGAARPVRPGRCGRQLQQRDREPGPPVLHHARHARAGPGVGRRRGDQREQGRADDRDPVRRLSDVSSAPREARGGDPARLPDASAQAAAVARADVCTALRAGRAGGGVRPGVRRRPGRARPAGVGGAGSGDQGARDVACDRDDPDVPGGVRRRGVPG